MTGPDRGRRGGPGTALLVGLALLAAPGAAAAPLGAVGTKAYDMARSADDGAVLAVEEGEKALAQLRALVPSRDAAPAPLKALQEEAAAAHEALVGYRKLAQAGAGEALQLLTEVSRLPVAPPDPIRRQTLEQQALLAAHEAAVMAARARAEAERLRAIHAEARLALGSRGGTAGGPAPAPRPVESAGRQVTVPNLVGARLDAATRDLQAAGLRLGVTTGPREGFVVKQSPEAGTPVARQAAVGVTLSATAATTTTLPPR